MQAAAAGEAFTAHPTHSLTFTLYDQHASVLSAILEDKLKRYSARPAPCRAWNERLDPVPSRRLVGGDGATSRLWGVSPLQRPLHEKESLPWFARWAPRGCAHSSGTVAERGRSLSTSGLPRSSPPYAPDHPTTHSSREGATRGANDFLSCCFLCSSISHGAKFGFLFLKKQRHNWDNPLFYGFPLRGAQTWTSTKAIVCSLMEKRSMATEEKTSPISAECGRQARPAIASFSRVPRSSPACLPARLL